MQKLKRVLALLLVVFLATAQLPVKAIANIASEPPLDSASNIGGGEIIAFDTLDEEIANQAVALGTSLEELNLPNTLSATVRVLAEANTEVPDPDRGTVQIYSLPQQEEQSEPGEDTDSGGEGVPELASGQSLPKQEGEHSTPEPDNAIPTPEPDNTQPNPEPDNTQPNPEPDNALPTPEPDNTIPTPEPDDTQPTPEPDNTQPTPEPDNTLPTPEPDNALPTPEPDDTQPTPEPDDTLPTPEPDDTLPTPEPDDTIPTPEPDNTLPTPEPDNLLPSPEPEDEQPISEADKQEQIPIEPETMEINMQIPVEWLPYPDYDGDKVGTYTFTAKIEGFTVSSALPSITVTVSEITGTVTTFEELPDGIRWQNMATPTFPKTVGGTVEGKAVQIPVTWQTEQHYDEYAPERGLYVFTAILSEGYILLGDTKAPRITVYIPETLNRFAPLRMGGGTDTSPLQITTKSQLVEISELVNAGQLENFLFNNSEANVYLELMNNLDLSSYDSSYNEGKGWKPIGTINNPFKAVFDGKGYTISSLYINDNTLEYAGLFGVAESATVKNLNLLAVSIQAANCAGGIVGYAYGSGIIENCCVSGSVSGSESESSGNKIGGLVGTAEDITISNSYASVTVIGNIEVGGLVGKLEDSNGKLLNCYVTGYVKGKQYVGGLTGYAYGKNIENCVALNNYVEATDSSGGRVTGDDNAVVLAGNGAFYMMDTRVNGSKKAIIDNADGVDGYGIDYLEIKGDGSFNSRFLKENGWTVENGKLPGFNAAVDLPEYLIAQSQPEEYFFGSGTEDDPYQISTAYQLAEFATLMNTPAEASDYSELYDKYMNYKYYKLIVDMDLSVYNSESLDFNDGKGWMPIGSNIEGASFKGHFDGNCKTITGLYINDSNLDYAGLFGMIAENSSIKNLALEDVFINAYQNVGSIAGSSGSNTRVENCYATGKVIGLSNYVGGLIGSIDGTTIENCYASCSVSSSGGYVGGLVGCANSSANISDSFALNPNVSGNHDVFRVAGLISDSSLSDNYAFSDMTGGGDEKALNGRDGADKTADDLMADFPSEFKEAPWTYEPGRLPGLFGKTVAMPDYIFDEQTGNFAGGNGTESEPYLIATAAQLAKLAENVNKSASTSKSFYKLINDIDLSDYGKDWNDSKGWIPIGTENNMFRGEFDGNGKVITGLYINRPDDDYIGLFGYIGTAFLIQPTYDGKISYVKNLGIVNADITGQNKVGGLVGQMGDGGYSEFPRALSTIENSYVTGKISGNDYVGGLEGYCYYSSTIRCYSTATITGNNNIGGLIGGSVGYVFYCYTECRINGADNVGGLVGTMNIYIGNSYSKGIVNGNSNIGGLVGYSNHTISSCYSTATVNGKNYVGGVLGKNDYKIYNCVALNSSVNGTSELGRVVGGTADTAVLATNYAFIGMKVNGYTVNSNDNNSNNGEYITFRQANSIEFWTNDEWVEVSYPDAYVGKKCGYWGEYNKDYWDFTDCKLPTLKNITGQSGDGGIYLTERDIANATYELGTENLIYSGSPIDPPITVTFDREKLVKNRDYIIDIAENSDSDGTNFGTVTFKLIGIGNFKGEITDLKYTIHEKTLTADMLQTDNFSYTGNEHKLTVSYGSITLVEGTDYYAIYTNNTNVGTASVYVAGMGNYTDAIHKTFTIMKAPLTITIETIAKRNYNGTNNATGTDVSFSGLQNDDILTPDDYTVEAQYDSADAGKNKTLTATVTLDNTETARNYSLSSRNLSITGQTINKSNTTGVDQIMYVPINLENSYEFDLNTLLPKINSPRTMGTVEFNPETKTNFDGLLGTLNYTSGDTLTVPINSLAAMNKTAVINVTVSSTNYNNFIAMIIIKTINPTKLTVTGLTVDTKIYDDTTKANLSGTAIPNIDDLQEGDELTIIGTPSANFADAEAGAGKAVTITGLSLSGKDAYKYHLDLSGFTGKISPKGLTEDMLTLMEPSFTYNGQPCIPSLTVMDDSKTLELNKDYFVSYSENTNAGTASVDITGMGNYTGSVSNTFTIAKAELTISGGTVTTKAYDGTTSATLSKVTFNGLPPSSDALVMGEDYTVEAQFNSADTGEDKTVTGTVTLHNTDRANNYILSNNNLTISSQTIDRADAPTITWPNASQITYGTPLSASKLLGGSTEYGSFVWSISETIPAQINNGYEVIFTPSDATMNNYKPISQTSQIVPIEVTPKGISDLTIEPIKAVTYTGSAHTPDVTIRHSGRTLVKDTDYTLSYPSNINAGTTKVIITGIGNYWEIIELPYTIKKAMPLALTWPNASPITYGETLSDSSLTGGIGAGTWAWTAGTTVPKTGTEGYEVTFTPADIRNYDWSSVVLQEKVPLTVHKSSGLTISTQTSMNAKEGVARSYEYNMNNITLSKADTGIKAYKASEDTDTNSILSKIKVNGSVLTYDIASSAQLGNTATILITITTANYLDVNTILTINVTEKETQTIAFEDSSLTKAYGDAKFTQAATLQGIGGTGQISYLSDNTSVATVDAATGEVTIVGAGSANITATKAADNNWFVAIASYGLMANKRTVTITAHDKTVKARQNEPTYTYEVKGFVFGEDLTTEPIVACPTANMNAPGTYAIVPSGAAASANYTIQYQNGSLTVSELNTACQVLNIISPTDSGLSNTIITARVSNSVSSQPIEVTVNADATWALYSDIDCTSEITNKVMPLSVGINKAYIRVTAEDGISSKIYTITITRSPSSEGGGTHGGGSSSGGGSPSRNTITNQGKQPDLPMMMEIAVTVKAGANGTSSASIPDKAITDAIKKAQEEAKKQNKANKDIGLTLDLTLPKESDSLSLTLSQSALQSMVNSNVQNLVIGGGICSLNLDLEAIKEIQKQSAGNITITFKPVTNLSEEAKGLIGDRPVYDVSISYIKDGKPVNISSLGKGSATLSLPYISDKNQTVGCLFGVYVDSEGNAIRIPDSVYDANSKSIILSSDHFSVYGVGYKAPTKKYNDISDHWAKEIIDYIIARGLISASTKKKFSPDTYITRGALVTALGRMAEVDTKKYTTSSFTDVKVGTTYSPYIEWAYENDILKGISKNKFSPNGRITLEEAAKVFESFAKATGYILPITREEVIFTDSSKIDSKYKSAVTAMQQSGIMMGGIDNKFNPKSKATRAQIAAMLHRYIKLTIDPATAQGWAINDAGQYRYYQNGKPLVGCQTIENNNTYYFEDYGNMVSGKWLQIAGKWYYFKVDGSLAKSTTIDDYEVDEKGVRKNK